MISSTELYFQVEHVRFQKEESGWCVLVAKTLPHKDSRTITVTGVFTPARGGMIVRSSGSWQNHPTYGPQWNSTGYVEEDPSDTETLITYLHGIVFQDIKGLGLKAAKDVVKHFGDQTLSILDESPQKLSELKKFTKARIKQVKKVWRKHRHSRHVILHLSAHGISMGKARKILHALPDNTLETLKKDPFILISKVQGFGFRTVDNIYLSLGGTLSSPDRFAAAIIYYLQHTRDQYGHSFLGKGQILQYLPQLLGLNPSEVQDITEPVIDEMTSMGRLITIDGQYKGHDFVLATHHTTPHTISPSTSPPSHCVTSPLSTAANKTSPFIYASSLSELSAVFLQKRWIFG